MIKPGDIRNLKVTPAGKLTADVCVGSSSLGYATMKVELSAVESNEVLKEVHELLRIKVTELIRQSNEDAKKLKLPRYLTPPPARKTA